MSMIKKIRVRCEGDVNTFWCFLYQDGTEENFYAFEGSPQYEVDDKRVGDKDPKLMMFLNILSDLTSQHLIHEFGAVDVDYDYYLNASNIVHQAPED